MKDNRLTHSEIYEAPEADHLWCEVQEILCSSGTAGEPLIEDEDSTWNL